MATLSQDQTPAELVALIGRQVELTRRAGKGSARIVLRGTLAAAGAIGVQITSAKGTGVFTWPAIESLVMAAGELPADA